MTTDTLPEVKPLSPEEEAAWRRGEVLPDSPGPLVWLRILATLDASRLRVAELERALKVAASTVPMCGVCNYAMEPDGTPCWVCHQISQREAAERERADLSERVLEQLLAMKRSGEKAEAAERAVAELRAAIHKALLPTNENSSEPERVLRAAISSSTLGAGWLSPEDVALLKEEHARDFARQQNELTAENTALLALLETMEEALNEIQGIFDNSRRASSKGAIEYTVPFMRTLVEPVIATALVALAAHKKGRTE